MGILKAYYYDSSTFLLADNIYIDAALTTTAPDGVYSVGSKSRSAVSGVLGPIDDCLGCSVGCGTGTIEASMISGVYNISYDTDNKAGVIVAEIHVNNSAVGFDFSLGGNSNYKISSEVHGLLLGSDFNKPTYIGESGEFIGAIGSTSYDAYDFLSNEWHINSSPDTFSVVSGNDETTAVNPGKCIMVLGKQSLSPQNVTLRAEAPWANSTFTANIKCTSNLSQVMTSVSTASHSTACAEQLTTTRYHVAVNGVDGVTDDNDSVLSHGTIGLYDFLFADNRAGVPMLDGYYFISGNKTIRIEDGLVTEIQDCGAD